MELIKYLFIFLFYLNNINDIVMGRKQSQPSWCDKKLCHSKYDKHVACQHNGQYAKRCPKDARMIALPQSLKDIIVHEHNYFRNEIAMGKIPGYKSSAKMATMVWDNELAYLASLNAKSCECEHDKCYNTYRFRNTGQCLSALWTDKDAPANMKKLFHDAIFSWFEEYKIVNMSYIDKFRVEYNFESYGHFTEMMVDRNTHVGCAAIRFSEPGQYYYDHINIACDYSSIHSFEHPVYESGYPASKCSTGSNPYYPGLCSLQEYFNPNIYDYDL